MMLQDDIQKNLGGDPWNLFDPQGKQIVLDIKRLIHMFHGHKYSLNDTLIPVRLLLHGFYQICQ